MEILNDAGWSTEPGVDVFCGGCGEVPDSVQPCTTPGCDGETCRYCDDGTGLCEKCGATGLGG